MYLITLPLYHIEQIKFQFNYGRRFVQGKAYARQIVVNVIISKGQG
jgi:hypothetical protein